MNRRRTFAFALAAALIVVSAGETAASGIADFPLRDRADRSFSPIPLGTTRPPQTLGLRELDEHDCHRSGECEWIDAERVRHYFWEGEFAVKSVVAAEFGSKPIHALGIGAARRREAVIAAVRAFLPEVEVDCDDVSEPAASAGHGSVSRVCGGTLEVGWFNLWFDSGDQLVEIRIDARHFT